MDSVTGPTLGRTDMLRMQRDGWVFPDRGWVKVANGWFVLATSPEGDFKTQIVADPEKEPEKWADDAGPKAEVAQFTQFTLL